MTPYVQWRRMVFFLDEAIIIFEYLSPAILGKVARRIRKRPIRGNPLRGVAADRTITRGRYQKTPKKPPRAYALQGQIGRVTRARIYIDYGGCLEIARRFFSRCGRHAVCPTPRREESEHNKRELMDAAAAAENALGCVCVYTRRRPWQEDLTLLSTWIRARIMHRDLCRQIRHTVGRNVVLPTRRVHFDTHRRRYDKITYHNGRRA